MEFINSFSDDALAVLFGLGVSATVHQDWLKAASIFNKLRRDLEINAVKLQTLQCHAFHKSTKKALFRTSMEKASNGGIEGRVLLPLVKDDTIDPKQSLERLILVCFTLQRSQYTAIINDGLESVFTRLMQGVGINISLGQGIRDLLSDIIRDVWAGKENNKPILDVLEDNERGQGSHSQIPKPPPVFTKCFAYELASASALELLLGDSVLLPYIQQSSRWLRERNGTASYHSKWTTCLSAFAPIDMAEDIELRIKIPWVSGWNIINSLQFEGARETGIIS